MHNKFTQDQQWQSWVWVKLVELTTPSTTKSVLWTSLTLKVEWFLRPWNAKKAKVLAFSRWIQSYEFVRSITSLIKHRAEPQKDWDKWTLMCGEGRCSFPRDSLEQWYPSLCIKYSGEYLKATPPVIHLDFRILATLPSPLPSPGITQLGAQDSGRVKHPQNIQAYLDVIWHGKEMAWEKVWKHPNVVDWPRKAKQKDIRRLHGKCLLRALKIVIFNPEILLLGSFPRKHVRKNVYKRLFTAT